MLSLLLVLACSTPSPVPPRPIHEQGPESRPGPQEAIDLLVEAIEEDPSNASAHYGLARLLSQLRNGGGVCRYDAYQDRVLRHLREAVNLDPEYREIMRKEPEYAPLRDTMPYRLIDGGSLQSDDTTHALLSGTVFYGLGIGAFGTLSTLTLHPDGRAVVGPTPNAAAAAEIGAPAIEVQEGTWSVSGGYLLLELDASERLHIHPNGDLTDDHIRWRSGPAECDA